MADLSSLTLRVMVAHLPLAILAGCGSGNQPSDATEAVRAAVVAVQQGKADAVDLAEVQIADADLKPLRQLKSLKKLDLGTGPAKITDDALGHLQHLTDLEVLVLGHAALTDRGVDALLKLPRLKRLNVTGTQITDAGFAKLCTLEELESLRFGSGRITAEVLPHVKRLKKLRFLILVGCPLTDAAVEPLKRMSDLKHLESLYLYGTQISDRGIEEIHDALAAKNIHVHY